MIKLAAFAFIMMAFLGGGFYLYQKSQTTLQTLLTGTNQQATNTQTTPTPTATIEEDYTALERELAEIEKLETDFNSELNSLE